MSSDKVNKIANYNQMMAWLTRPEAPKEQFSDRSDFAIGGGAIEGEDLGTREGFQKPKKTYTKYEDGKDYDKLKPATLEEQLK